MCLIRLFSCLLQILFLTSCCFINPSLDEEVAKSYALPWGPVQAKEIHHTQADRAQEQSEIQMLEEGKPWHIDHLIDIALRNNPETRATWEYARSFAYQWRESKSLLYPVVDLSEQLLIEKVVSGGGVGFDAVTGAGISDNVVISGGNGTRNNQWLISSLSFSYLILDFGGRTGSIEAAREALFRADWTHNRNIQTVMLQVLTAYYHHQEAKALVAAKELDVKEAKENLTAAEEQFDAGVVTIVDVLQTKTAYVNMQFQLEQFKGFFKTTLASLATAMGMPANAQFDLVPLPEDLPFEKVHQDIDTLIATAKAERPDLAAAEAYWKEQEANVVVARSAGLPTFTASGIAEKTGNIQNSRLSSEYYSGAITMNMPIFSGFFYINQTKSKQANAAAAFAEWKTQENSALLEVVTSYTDFNTAAKQVMFADENFFYAEKAYEAALANYKFGINTILDVLAAEAALSNARAQKIESRTFWIISLTNIAYATGTL